MGLFENMNAETVRSLNLRVPVLVKPDEKVRDVVGAMRKANLGCAIVIDDRQKPVGMFTESMLTQIVATKPDALDEPISSHDADRWPQVSLSDPIVAVLEALETRNIRFLAVVDKDGHVVGLAGQKGLMEYVAEHFPRHVMVQRIGQTHSMRHREGA